MKKESRGFSVRDKALDLWKNRGKNLHPVSQKPQKQEDLEWSEVFKVLRERTH